MTTQFCAKCGAKLAPKNHFCPVCGADATQPAAKSRQKPLPRRKQRRNSRSSNSLALWAVVGGVVLLLIVGAYALANTNRPAPAPAVSSIPDAHNEEGIPYPEVVRVSTTEAKALYDAGSALFVDVRSQGEYDTAHMAKALSLPLADLEARYRELPKDATIITYCT